MPTPTAIPGRVSNSFFLSSGGLLVCQGAIASVSDCCTFIDPDPDPGGGEDVFCSGCEDNHGPYNLLLTISGIVNDTCSGCPSVFNGQFVVHGWGPCTWVYYLPGTYCNSSYWKLSFGINPELGTIGASWGHPGQDAATTLAAWHADVDIPLDCDNLDHDMTFSYQYYPYSFQLRCDASNSTCNVRSL